EPVHLTAGKLEQARELREFVLIDLEHVCEVQRLADGLRIEEWCAQIQIENADRLAGRHFHQSANGLTRYGRSPADRAEADRICRPQLVHDHRRSLNEVPRGRLVDSETR